MNERSGAGIKETLQEDEYDFPYHHLVQINPFSETRNLFWGYKYAAYLEKILDTLAGLQFNSIIDFGCGDGKVLYEIIHRFPDKRIVGVDYSEKSLRFAQAFSPSAELKTKTDEKFDGFVLIEVLEHVSPVDMQAFLDALGGNLKDGGFGIITTPCDNVPVNPKHYQHFNRETIMQTLGNHFEIVSFEYTSAETLGSKLLQRLLANRFFILNEPHLAKFLYNRYKKLYLHAKPSTASQVFVVVRKK